MAELLNRMCRSVCGLNEETLLFIELGVKCRRRAAKPVLSPFTCQIFKPSFHCFCRTRVVGEEPVGSWFWVALGCITLPRTHIYYFLHMEIDRWLVQPGFPSQYNQTNYPFFPAKPLLLSLCPSMQMQLPGVPGVAPDVVLMSYHWKRGSAAS